MGIVTFLFTDLEGSTRLWEEHADSMELALARHDVIVRGAIESHGGHVVKTTGDGVFAVFAGATSAVDAASAVQVALHSERWPDAVSLRVRMGLHTSDAQMRDDDYFGSAVNRTARLMATAHGGQIVLSGATAALVRQEGLELRDLGEIALRDLSVPEHVFQVCVPGLPVHFPPLRGLASFRGNLPAHVTTFVGRAEDVRRVTEAAGISRLVTLTGVGGVGKSRLAVQVAAELLPVFPAGAWLVELAPASDEDAMMQIVTTTLGASPRAGSSPEAAMADFLRSKRALVVLDNCEHLLDASARLVEGILRSCPEVRLLATSREALAADGEQIVPVRPLAAIEAEQLFIERATAVRPSFTVDDDGRAAIGEICRRLDGIPLAVELAAGRTESMSPVEIAELLDERFRLLTGGRRTALERHQTLRATVDWSYLQLGSGERTLFDRLGLFAGSFDTAAAVGLASEGDLDAWAVRDGLEQLVRRSMLNAEHSDDGTTRYSMLETLRSYAREQLDESGATDQWRRRFATYFTDLAEALGPRLLSADELTVRVQLRQELDNLRSAVMWALETADDADAALALRLVAALAMESHLSVASGIGRWAVLAADRALTAEPRLRRVVLGAAAVTAMYQGDLERAERLAQQGIEADVPLESPNTTLAQSVVSIVRAASGSYDEALVMMGDIIEIIGRTGSRAFERSHVLSTRAMMLVSIGRHDEAKQDCEEALRLARDIEHPSSVALAQFTQGWILSEREPEAALAALEESIALSRRGAVDSSLTLALAFAARISVALGDLARAAAALREAIGYSNDAGDEVNLAGALGEAIGFFRRHGDDTPTGILTGAFERGALQQYQYLHNLRVSMEHMDEELNAGARERGAGMTLNEVVNFTLALLDDLRVPPVE